MWTAAALALVAASPQPTVAIMYFDYQGKDEQLSLLRKGLAQMLISDLTGDPRYQIVERDRLQEILAELKLNQSAKIDKKTANKIGKLLGARFMVMGGYFDLMGSLRVDARVVEVETGKVMKSVGAFAAPEAFIEIERKLAGDLALTLSGLTPKATKPSKKKKKKTRVRPKRPKKLKLKTALRYSKALDAKDKGDLKTAKREFAAVVKERPDFEIAQLDLNSLIQ